MSGAMKHLALLVAAAGSTACAPAVAASFTGQFSNDTPTPVSNPSCASGQVYVSFNPSNSTATGTSNLGAFGPSQSHCLTPGQAYVGVFSFDFAAGDMFSGTTTGYMTPTDTVGVFNSFVTYMVSGGTGRFVGATGTINGIGLLDRRPARPLNDLTLSGTLDLAAVPEPATWTLMILGFGAVSGAVRSKRHLRGRDASPRGVSAQCR